MIPPKDELQLESIRRDVQSGLIDLLDPNLGGDFPDGDLRAHCEARVEKLVSRLGRGIDEEDRVRIATEVIADAFGLGPLDGLLEDELVTDILINAPDRIFIEKEGRLIRTGVGFRDEAHLMHVVQRLVRRSGRRLDERSPMVDARLPDGSRVNIIIPPLALEGPQVSIRRFAKVPFDLDRLVRFGSMAVDTARLLGCLVAGRLNIAITGGAGSGKTTLLNALSGFIDTGERVITIEDAAELRLAGEHVVRLETRAANLEGVGSVDASALVRNSLRMRPDRIIVGECRGAETFDMLQAMNTGHEGSMTTLHANSARDAMFRMESMLTMSGFEAPISVLREYLGSALDVVVHIERLPGGQRVISAISEVGVAEDRSIELREIHRFRLERVEDGIGQGVFEATGTVPCFIERLRSRGHAVPDEVFEAGELPVGGRS
ncbi:MAG: pilus assembly protein CpaF [Phycisphaerae bacterium]|nr:pilus assembly protein CpaF [Phycisphaerae bacterium]